MVSIATYHRVYDLYRNCILNELYYGRKLSLYARLALWLDVVIVLGSGASGISGWIIWTQHRSFAMLWAAIAAAAVLFAALKPVLRTDSHIKRYSALFSGYRQLALSMGNVVHEIKEQRGITRGTLREVERVSTRYRNLSHDDDPRPSQNLVAALQDEVNERVPISSLLYPISPVTSEIASTEDEPAIAGDADGVNVRIDPVEPWPQTPGRN
jgi:hypothetical protein